MMSHYWNHRVIKKVYPNGEEYYSVHEVHYNPDGTIYGHTVDPIQLSCESMDALREYILWCLKSLDKPILEDGKIEFVSYEDDIIPEEFEDDEEEIKQDKDDDVELYEFFLSLKKYVWDTGTQEKFEKYISNLYDRLAY